MKLRYLLAVTCVAMATPAHSQPVLNVVGTDYAFVALPTTIPAGRTFFTFENHGKVRHELSIVLLKPGITLTDIIQGKTGVVSSRAVSDSIVGILVARPGEAAGGRLLAELHSGRRYLLVCTLRDLPEAKPHIEMGMVAAIDVP